MILAAAGSAAGATLYDPALRWRTVTSPRFAVHYHEGARNLAVRAARIAEEVLDELGELFGYAPGGRIDVVLVDSADDANGSAQVLPRNIVRLYLAAPTELTGLSSYDDWLRILLVHELAHVCDLDQTWGVARALRLLFGKYVAMNAYTPQFLSEGAAVYAETLLTPTGRGRSSYVAMLLRMAALEGRFLAIDQAHLQYSDWPGPNAAYFYGGFFHLWLASRYGREAVRDLHRFYASMPLPYLYWFGAKRVFGKSLPALWAQWRAEEERFAREVAAAVAAEGLTASRRLTHHGRNLTGARYSPDASFIVYSRTSPEDGATIRRVDRDGRNDRRLVLETYSPRFSFTADGASFYFSQTAVNDRFDSYNDLYRYDIARDRTVRLRDKAHPERSLRARDPDVSPDGRRLVFVQNALEQSWVSVADIGGADGEELTTRILVPPSGEMQHAGPRFSPDGRLVAISTWFPGGLRDIILVDAATGALVRRVTHDTALDGNPAWSPDGRHVLYESDSDGISNLYAFDLAHGTYHRITRVVGGAFQPDVSRDGRTLLFRNASGIGFDIHEMPFAPATWEPVAYDPTSGYRRMDDRTPELTAAAVLVSHGTPAPAAGVPDWARAPLPAPLARADEPPLPLAPDEHEGPYRIWRTLLPFQDNWVLLPAVFFLYDDPTFSLTTFGTDVLGRHLWALSAGTGFGVRRLNWAVQYLNDVWYPTFGLGASELHTQYGRIIERRRTLAAAMSLPLAQRHLLALEYVLERRAELAGAPVLLDGTVGYVEAGYRYHRTRRFPYSVGAEHGGTAAAAVRWYGEGLGSKFDELMLTLDARVYLNNPLAPNHVLALRLATAVALGPEFEERFLVGGPQGTSLLTVQTDTVYPLRGFRLDPDRYEPTTGILAGYAEYRFPLWHVERGLSTLPIYLERLHAAFFVDSAAAFGDGREPHLAAFGQAARKSLAKPRTAVGVEARADVSLGWALPLTLRLGAGAPVVDPTGPPPPPLLYFSLGTAL